MLPVVVVATAAAAVTVVVVVVESATTGDEDVSEEAVHSFERFCLIFFTLLLLIKSLNFWPAPAISALKQLAISWLLFSFTYTVDMQHEEVRQVRQASNAWQCELKISSRGFFLLGHVCVYHSHELHFMFLFAALVIIGLV